VPAFYFRFASRLPSAVSIFDFRMEEGENGRIENEEESSDYWSFFLQFPLFFIRKSAIGNRK